MSKIFLATSLATLLCASLAAQAPQAQDPGTSRVAPPAAGAGSTTADPQTARSAAKPESISVEGCITRGAAGGATAGTTGTTAPAPAAFMLTSAMKPAGSTATAPIASSYRLDAVDSKLSPHVGHKVEITGTLAPEGASASAAAKATPTLKVDNVKMIAATCTP
jgi:hypothetical protein